MTILVVDDEEVLLRFVSNVLHKDGHTVLTAVDGPRGLNALARHKPDLLISDVVMPTMTGPELAAAARRLQPGLSILLMSGSERPDGYDFLAKPFRAQSLIAAVKQIADRGRPGAPAGT
jgi:two-component system cell cycle sensor histidine kinase/response regulator CckA